MQPSDRIHPLDAVCAYALILGVALHSTASFIEGFPMPTWFGAILNGRWHPQPGKSRLADMAPSM
jgi:hypothetical protein